MRQKINQGAGYGLEAVFACRLYSHSELSGRSWTSYLLASICPCFITNLAGVVSVTTLGSKMYG